LNHSFNAWLLAPLHRKKARDSVKDGMDAVRTTRNEKRRIEQRPSSGNRSVERVMSRETAAVCDLPQL